ncbi:MAG: hypothetical protein K9M19_03820 [Candidatus Marinimicrobia bacterium]|nr:hypothetical protein [Candidatus Neomarinimicrobiota bacterium]
MDADGDGFNDNAPDADGDGIPNGQDDDYAGTCDGSGSNGANMGGGQGNGPADGSGNGRRAMGSGSGFGPGSGTCDGSGPAVSPQVNRTKIMLKK